MFNRDELDAINRLFDTKFAQMGLRRLVGEVATVTGDATSGYYVTLYLAGNKVNASAPVRCLRHYVPTIGDRVSVLTAGTTMLEVLGKIN